MSIIQRNSPSESDLEEGIATLKKGSYLLKYGRRGKPKFLPFRLSSDEKMLIWYRGKREKQLKLNRVSRIIPGQRTAIFQRYPQPEKQYQSFSLLYGSRSLDVICKDKDEAEIWITALRAIILRNGSGISKSDSISSTNVLALSILNSASNDSVSSTSTNTIPKDPGDSQKIRVTRDRSLHSRLGRAFSEVLSHSASTKAYPRVESVPTSLHAASGDFDNLPSRPSAVSFHSSLSSALSSSSHGSAYQEDFSTLYDVFLWGEGTCHGLLGGGHKKEDASGSSNDALLPKILKSSIALDPQNIACGSTHALLVTKQGHIFSWGEGSGGRLGHGMEADISHPKRVNALGGSIVELAACGEFHTCVVTPAGDLYAWGDGIHNLGLLGVGSEIGHWKPVRVFGQMEGIYISHVSCGAWHTAAVTSTGKLFTFGDGTFGALGHGDRISTNIPREVETLKGLRTVRTSCGIWHTAAIVEVTTGNSTSDSPLCGSLFTWGDGDKGQLGHGDQEPRFVPSCVAVPDATNFQQVACGHSITVALTLSGQLYYMGIIDNGNHEKACKFPTCIKGNIGNSHIEEVACGANHIAILSSKAEVFTWGKGANGQLGHGDNASRNIPTLVEALKDKHAKRVVCGSNFTAAICLHTPISGADHSTCSGCQNPFNLRRKRHNCYNCGRFFCKACTSKNSVKAAMAPSINKSFRVCDDCYSKLTGGIDSASHSKRPRRSTGSINFNLNEVDEKEPPSSKSFRQLCRLASFDSFRQAKSQNCKLNRDVDSNSVFEHSRATSVSKNLFSIEVNKKETLNSISGKRLSRLASFDSSSLLGKGQYTKNNLKVATSVIDHSLANVHGYRKVPGGKCHASVKPSPACSVARTSTSSDLAGSEFNLYESSQSNDFHTQELALLRAQVEDLTRKSHILEAELKTTSIQLREAIVTVQKEAQRTSNSKGVIRSLTLQLTNVAGKVSQKPKTRTKSI